MSKSKTSLTLLKRMGFVLIALPEPITTPIGVACVMTSSYLSKLHETNLNKHLQETLSRYVSHTKRKDHEANGKSHVAHKLRNFNRDEAAISSQIMGISPVQGEHLIPVVQNLHEPGDIPVTHGLNTEPLNHPIAVAVTAPEEKLIHHNLDVASSSRRHITTDTKSVEIEKSVHHVLNIVSIPDRYPVKGVTSADVTKSVHHHSNAEAFSNHYSAKESTPVETGKSIHHRLNAASVSNRYPTRNGASFENVKPVPQGKDKGNIGRRNWGEQTHLTDLKIPAKSGAVEKVTHQVKHISLSRNLDVNNSAGSNSKVKPTSETSGPVKRHYIRRDDPIQIASPAVEEVAQHHPIKRFDSDWIPSHSNKAAEHHSIGLKQLSQPYGRLEPVK